MKEQEKNNHLQNNNKDSKQSTLLVERREMFSGPLPHPEILERYNSIVPGSAQKIIQMAENQSAHRIDIEKKVIGSDIRNSHRGQIFGFIIAITGIISSLILIIRGYTTGGSILGGGTVVSLAAIFVYGARARNRERMKKESDISNLRT